MPKPFFLIDASGKPWKLLFSLINENINKENLNMCSSEWNISPHDSLSNIVKLTPYFDVLKKKTKKLLKKFFDSPASEKKKETENFQGSSFE